MGSEAIAKPVGEERVKSVASKKNPGKVPKKIHKAEREKMKRDRMNDLFLDLEKVLGLEHPNNGKACILRETVRLIGELLSKVDNLKTDNVALVSESNYVTSERDELVEETSALGDQIKRLQREIDERGSCVIPDMIQPTSNDTTHLPENQVPIPYIGHAPEAAPVLAPLFVMPIHQELDKFPCPEMDTAKSNVSRPRPRYPSSFDIWPSHILEKQTNVTGDA